MSEGHLAIRLGNGVEVLGEKDYHFDAGVIEACGTHCISHVHSDHLPKKVIGSKVVCSDLTLHCFNGRTKKKLELENDHDLEMFNAGHMAGSRMFRTTEERKVLYTGDLSTRDRFGSEGARPVKADVLIIESTYGKPRYVFPDTDLIGGVIRDWVEDTLAQNYSVALFAYPFGKSQDMVHLLSEFNPYLDTSVFNATQMVWEKGKRVCYQECSDEAASEIKDPSLIICSSWFDRSKTMEAMRKKWPVKKVAVSGWAVDEHYRRRLRVDEAFPFSDHADFDELIAFTKACDPSLVLTHHGFDEALAGEIKSRLGIEARPLIKNQRTLAEF
jgi:putative mRNA 3-end processing factor